MVEFKNISFSYSKESGVYDIDLKVQDSEFCFLVGPTGSGKTSLLKMIYFDILPLKGEINVLWYNSKKTKKNKVHKLRKKIGVIFQDYKLLQQRTVYENIALPLHINGVGRKKIKDNVEEALELADILDCQNKYPNHGILGEEYSNENLESEFIWVIDPIDGTRSFIAGHKDFGNLIALLHYNKPVIGIINCPAHNERWIGIKNKKTTFNGIKVNTSQVNELKDA